ncbi:MFS transporter [Arthrobacter castelli]|uniref:MFS transporter n=1 Tax=Arthrobacter castelli TaxID=271431 RepID=UPI001FE03894|nr:MFS transporter [Arthrobacter castelli]
MSTSEPALPRLLMSSASSGNTDTGTSPEEKRRIGGLARYIFAATLVRSADGGAVVAIVLLATANGAPGWVAGILGASITAPHLLGPFIARRLDTARDGRKVIAVSGALHGVLLGAAALLLPITGGLWPAIPLVASGAFGPMITGGVSSRLPSIAGPGLESHRRAQSWDVVSYGMSATLGPAAVAWITATSDVLTATLVLAGSAVLGAGAVLVLPKQAPLHHTVDVPSPVGALRVIWRNRPLRRTLSLTVTVAFTVAALPVYAVAVAPMLGAPAAAGTLVAAYGIGNLLGAAGLILWPLRGNADRLMSLLAVVVATFLTLVMLVPTLATSLAAFGLAGAANAIFFAATLAARSEYSSAETRSQVFIWVGALKIAAGSAGTAAAGAAIAYAVWTPLALAATLTAIVAIVTVVDRSRSRSLKP